MVHSSLNGQASSTVKAIAPINPVYSKFLDQLRFCSLFGKLYTLDLDKIDDDDL